LPSKEYYKDEKVVRDYQNTLAQIIEALHPDHKDENTTLQTRWATESVNQELASREKSQKAAHDVVEFEKKLAAASPDAEDADDVTVSFIRLKFITWPDRVQKYYNPRSLHELDKLVPQLQLPKVLKSLSPTDYNPERVIVTSPEYLTTLSKLLKETPKEVLQTYFIWKTIQSFSSEIESDALKPYTRFRNELQGKVSSIDRNHLLPIWTDRFPGRRFYP
jgi:endothelin-converting enzyme